MTKKVLIVYNPQKKNAISLAKGISGQIKSKYKKEIIINICSSEKITNKNCVADLILALGGDGTILRVSPYAVERLIPVAGINIGGLGYLAEFNPSDVNSIIDEFITEKLELQNRLVLDVTYKNKHHYALNDCVLKPLSSKVCNIELFIEKQKLTNIVGDGVIVATPTGSTAYSLACGGSIVEPEANVILITPISPHTLSIRPLLISPEKTITLRIPVFKSNKQLLLSLDGQRNFFVEPLDEIIIKIANKRFLFIPNRKKNFFKILTQKLSWGVR
ncbi:MAG: NAD(+)/NADH kinase [Elusimicrobiota bacterium]|nr:NAD(+)/NADH kinase [Elusimicrobiota bacterium]